MIKAINLTISYSSEPLYKDVNFLIGKGQKVGIVGPNGAGKSTLLKIILGEETAYQGKIVVEGTMAYVPQEIKHDKILENSKTIREYIDPKNKIESYEIKKMLSKLEADDLHLETSPLKLSGGQKTKISLARALFSNPDILLLDEPTNFMDVEGRRWVMNFLSNYEGNVLVISHDLELMDKSINKVLAVNPTTKTIEEYKGNYTTFVRLKKEKDELLRKQVLVKEKHIQQMEEGLKKMARFTSGKGVRRRIQQKRRIEKEKLELPELPREIKTMKISLPEPTPVGELPVSAKEISKSFSGNKIIENLSISILRGERVVLIGANGTGKSTFIKLIMGIHEPDMGTIKKDDNIKIGYYSQEFETFDFEKSVIDEFIDKTKKDERFSRAFLGKYMFSNDKVFQKVKLLSGGEKTRLSIAILTAQNNNTLILDEPTTYLDVMSQRVILEALKEYKGTMILVSHTPDFVKELKPKRAILFPEDKVYYWEDELLDKIDEI